MTVIALASIKGSPGVTTAATAMAAGWPAGCKVLLVEADPFGGDLAPRYGSTITGGLASLFAAARRTLDPKAVWDHVNQLPGGLPVLFGLSGVHQAVANEQVWPEVAKTLGGLDADVVVDVGRLLPAFAGGVSHVLDQADVLVVLCEPTLEAIVHLRDALPRLVSERRGRQLLVIPTASVGYSAEDIAKTLQVTVGRPMPNDPAAAAALANRRNIKKLGRTRLLKWAASVIADLGIDERSATGGGDGEAEEELVSDEQCPADVDAFPAAAWDRSGPEVAPVGAGSKWEARR